MSSEFELQLTSPVPLSLDIAGEGTQFEAASDGVTQTKGQETKQMSYRICYLYAKDRKMILKIVSQRADSCKNLYLIVINSSALPILSEYTKI